MTLTCGEIIAIIILICGVIILFYLCFKPDTDKRTISRPIKYNMKGGDLTDMVTALSIVARESPGNVNEADEYRRDFVRSISLDEFYNMITDTEFNDQSILNKTNTFIFIYITMIRDIIQYNILAWKSEAKWTTDGIFAALMTYLSNIMVYRDNIEESKKRALVIISILCLILKKIDVSVDDMRSLFDMLNSIQNTYDCTQTHIAVLLIEYSYPDDFISMYINNMAILDNEPTSYVEGNIDELSDIVTVYIFYYNITLNEDELDRCTQLLNALIEKIPTITNTTLKYRYVILCFKIMHIIPEIDDRDRQDLVRFFTEIVSTIDRNEVLDAIDVIRGFVGADDIMDFYKEIILSDYTVDLHLDQLREYSIPDNLLEYIKTYLMNLKETAASVEDFDTVISMLIDTFRWFSPYGAQ